MSRHSAWVGFALIFVTCLVFGRVCLFEFTIWDDNVVVWANPLLNPPTLAHTLKFWTEPYYTLYLPVTYTLWAIMAAAGWIDQPDAWGNHLNPYLFHGLNLALHVACVLLVWRLIGRLIANDWAAAFGALLFALHPVQVETVAWVTGTRDLLGTLLSTAAVLAFLNFCDAERGARRWMWTGLATLLFVAALFSKPTAVVTPVFAAVAALWTPRRWRMAEWGLLGAWLLIAAVDAIATQMNQPVDPLALRDQPAIWFRPFVALDALAFYAWKLIWPFSLGIDYGRTPLHLRESGAWIWTWTVPVFIAGLLLPLGRRAWVCAGIFIVGLLPLLGLLPFRFQVYYGTVSDRYLYPAMIGLSLALALGLSKLRWTSTAGTHRILPTITAISLMACGIISSRQLGYWRDSMSLFTRAIEVNPLTFAGHRNRGVVETHDGWFQAAEADFRAMLVIVPGAPEAYRGLARADMGMAKVDDAMANWTAALAAERRTIAEHGAMGADFDRELSEHYREAASVAESAGRVDQALQWRKQASSNAN